MKTITAAEALELLASLTKETPPAEYLVDCRTDDDDVRVQRQAYQALRDGVLQQIVLDARAGGDLAIVIRTGCPGSKWPSD